MKYFFGGCLFWGIVLCALWAVRPGSALNTKTIQNMSRKDKGLFAAVLISTILLCTLPMSLSPVWNGEIPEHRNQYEVLAESILEGRIDLDYGDTDPLLLQMENPYNPEMRTALGVYYHYDHAFYNGKYYMYFGIVPVLLLFLPFRLITGSPLTTYHATQFFTAVFIAGLFALFLLLAKKFFKSMSFAVYLTLSAAMSVMSVWYLSKAPALYCTAIAAGICAEVWSLFFFAKAVWGKGSERRSTVYGFCGSLTGALAFGCRPTVALANLLAVPLFFHYIKRRTSRSADRPYVQQQTLRTADCPPIQQRATRSTDCPHADKGKIDAGLVKQILIVVSPYIVIGVLLMLYNYVRFDSVFEFGQSYQLTKADQSGYGSVAAQFGPIKILDGVLQNFFACPPLKYTFPFISAGSVFFNFPVCAAALFCLFQKDTLSLCKKSGLAAFTAVLFSLPVLITVMQCLMSPFLLERYRSDIYWLMGLLTFLAFGLFGETLNGRTGKIAGSFCSLMAFATVFSAFLLWMIPDDGSYTELFPEALSAVEKILFFGLR